MLAIWFLVSLPFIIPAWTCGHSQFTYCWSLALSRVWLCDPMHCSTPGLPVHHQLLEFTQTHVHQVSYAIQPSHPLSSPHTSKAMLKILQARLQQYMNHELADVQAGFRKGRGSRDQIGNICWVIEKAREFQKNIYFCFIEYTKAFDCVHHNKLWKILKEMVILDPPYLPPEKSICR